MQAILSSDKIRLSHRKEKKSIKLSPRNLRSTSPRNNFQKVLFNHEDNMDGEVIDHRYMFVYGSQPLGGWNDNLGEQRRITLGTPPSDHAPVPGKTWKRQSAAYDAPIHNTNTTCGSKTGSWCRQEYQSSGNESKIKACGKQAKKC